MYAKKQYQEYNDGAGSFWGRIVGGLLGAGAGAFLGNPTLGISLGSVLGSGVGSLFNGKQKRLVGYEQQQDTLDLLLQQIYRDIMTPKF